MHLTNGLECVLHLGHELFLTSLLSADGKGIADVSVKRAICASAVLEKNSHEVAEVNLEGRGTLVECLSKAANDHDAV